MRADAQMLDLTRRSDDAPGWGPRIGLALLLLVVVAFLSAGIVQYSYRAPAAIVGLAVGLAILWNPFFGLLALIVALPFETAGMLGDPDAPGALSIMKLAGVGTLGGLFFDTFGRRRPIELSRLGHPLTVLVALLAAVTLFATLAHPTEESLRECVRFFTIVAFFVVIVHLVDTPERLWAALTAWVIVATLVAVYSLVQRKFGATVSSVEWEPTAGTIIDISEEEVGVMRRAAGPFTHPIWLALYLTLALPITLGHFWATRRPWLKLAWAGAALIQVAGVVVTYSRMGYLAVVLGAALLLLRRRGGPALLICLTLVGLATVPMWPDELKTRIVSIFEYRHSASSITRIGQQLVGWWMFRDHPFTGVGPGNFEHNVRYYADRVSDTLRIEEIAAHNMYIQVLAELGLQGVLLILALLWVAWRSAERGRRRTRDPILALAYESMGVSVIVLVFSAVLIHATYQKEWWFLLALVAAGDWIAARQARAPAPTSEPRAASHATDGSTA